MTHLTQETVLALIDGQLSDQDASAVDDHMDECASCRALIAEVARGSFLRPAGSVDEDDAPTKPGIALYPGQVLATRFEIVRRLGRGSMGVVYEAIDTHLNVRVALKVLPPEQAASEKLLKRLQKEIVLGRRITHPNVCRLYDFGSSNGVHFISMEYLEGETLQSILSRGPLPELAARNVIWQILEALEVAHELGVVHRDLKPSNIMVSPSGKVHVMDFGLAADLDAERSEHGVAVGTPAYWAPEQARGEAATPQSDMYSLGVIACECFGAKRPKWGQPPDLGMVPRPYRGTIQRSLRESPGDRFATIREARYSAAAALGWATLRLPRYRPLSLGFSGVMLVVAGLWLHDFARDESFATGAFGPSRTVMIETTPREATIIEAGQRLGVGRAPIRFERPDAELRTLRVELPGYETREVEVGPLDGPSVRVGLRRAAPRVSPH